MTTSAFRRIFARIIRKFHLVSPSGAWTEDMEPEFLALYTRCQPYTMTSIERMYGLYTAVRHIQKHRIAGDLVECGVWKGGSCMLCALTLLAAGDISRTIFLYDTFEGMTKPSPRDIDYRGTRALDIWASLRRGAYSDWPGWHHASLAEVRRTMLSTGYPEEKIRFVPGKVEDTLPGTLPDRIAILRLDTDWYESTRHELLHLFPRLVPGGVLLVDDYGHYRGAREAVDEYLDNNQEELFLVRIDYTGRIGVKRR